MLNFVLILISVGFVKSECAYESTRLFCTNLEKNKETKTLILGSNGTDKTDDAKWAYLRNSSGKITKETLSLTPKLQSLDIQFCSIDEFLPKSTALDTLYVINNSKFPKLNEELIKNCCKHFKTLFIANNTEMEIEEGSFKYTINLTHLTISKQNITHLRRNFLEGLKKLTYLNLRQNGIIDIDNDAFAELLELSYLDLSDNNFKSIGADTFENLRLLETLELYGLHLGQFNVTVFSKQKQLRQLGLSTSLIKKKLELTVLTRTFPTLETIGIQDEDKDDLDVVKFVAKCTTDGFHIKFSVRNM